MAESQARLVDLNINDKRVANDVQRLGQLEVTLSETPWHRFGARKKLQDDINHIQWRLFFWAVKYKGTGTKAATAEGR